MLYFAILWLSALLSLPLLDTAVAPPWNLRLLIGTALFLVLSPIGVFAYLIIYAWRSRKDYYAFLSLTGYLGFMSLLVVQLMQPQILAITLDLLRLKIPSDQSPPPLSVIFLLTVIALATTAGFALFIRQYYTNKQEEPVPGRSGRLHPFLAEILKALAPQRSPEPPIVVPTEPPKPPQIEPFFQRALDAARRKYPQYSWIKLQQRGWAPQVECWLGEDNAGGTVVLLCNAEPLSMDAQRTRLEQIRKTVGEKSATLLQCAKSRQHLFEASHAFADQIIYNDFLDTAVNFAEYRHYIRAEATERKLDNSDLTLSDIYVQRKVIDQLGVVHDFRGLMGAWGVESSRTVFVLTAEYGMGKTSTVLYETMLLLQDEGVKRAPVLIRMHGRGFTETNIRDFLVAWASSMGMDGTLLWLLFVEGRILLMLDGFDEMQNVADAVSRKKHFDRIWALAAPAGSKVMIIGRPEIFASLDERQALLRTGNTGTYSAVGKVYTLLPFKRDELGESMRNCSPQTRAEIIELFDKDKHFADLIGRPSITHLVATNWDSPDFQEVKSDITAGKAIRYFVFSVFERQEAKLNDPDYVRTMLEQESISSFMQLDRAEIGFFTAVLALSMAREGSVSSVSRAQMRSIIERAYQNLLSADIIVGPESGRKSETPIKMKFQDIENPIEQIETSVRTYGVVVESAGPGSSLIFSHQSYAEVLVADYFVKRLFGASKEYTKLVSSCANLEGEAISEVVRTQTINKFCADLIEFPPHVSKSPNGRMAYLFRRLAEAGVARYLPKQAVWLLHVRLLPGLYSMLRLRILRSARRRRRRKGGDAMKRLQRRVTNAQLRWLVIVAAVGAVATSYAVERVVGWISPRLSVVSYLFVAAYIAVILDSLFAYMGRRYRIGLEIMRMRFEGDDIVKTFGRAFLRAVRDGATLKV